MVRNVFDRRLIDVADSRSSGEREVVDVVVDFLREGLEKLVELTRCEGHHSGVVRAYVSHGG